MPQSSQLRQRAGKKQLRVSFPDGAVYCFPNSKDTMVNALRHIGADNFPLIDLCVAGHRWVTQEVPAKFGDNFEPLTEGWFLITQSTTDQRYMQLRAIATKLGLDMRVEVGTGFEVVIPEGYSPTPKHSDKASKLAVRFPDGTVVRERSVVETFCATVQRLGIEKVRGKDLQFAQKPLVSFTQQYHQQREVAPNAWLYIPANLTDCSRMLRIIASALSVKLEIGSPADFPDAPECQVTSWKRKPNESAPAPEPTPAPSLQDMEAKFHTKPSDSAPKQIKVTQLDLFEDL